MSRSGMSGSICVLKRDGTIEAFDQYKLGACVRRVLTPSRDNTHRADVLAAAVGCYLRGSRFRCISSAAILEMTLVVLRAAGLSTAAGQLESWHRQRLRMRSRLRLHHGDGCCTAWSKQWLVRRARSNWSVGRAAARILAGEIEKEFMQQDVHQVERAEVIGMLDEMVAAYGLVIACPLGAAAWSGRGREEPK